MSGTIGTITQTVVGTTEVHRVELAIVAGSLNVYGDGASSIGDVDGLQDALDLKVSSSALGVTVATLVAGTVPADQLPSYVDDVLEFANLAAFPATGATGKIYVALDTNKAYRWSGSVYVYITSGAVDSVAGRTGIITLTKSDVGLSNVDNTSDLLKPLSTADIAALALKQDVLANASASVTGKLTSTDWSTFNAKAVATYLKNIFLWTHSTSTNGNMQGTTLTGNGSFLSATPTAAGSIWAGMARSLYANLTTTANQVLGVRTGESIFHVGSVAGKGGFTYRARFGMEVWNNAGRFFAGICAGTSLVVTANPSTNNNSCGFCVDDNDSGLISFVTRNGTTTTKTSTGKTMVSGAAFDIEIIVAPNGTTAAWSIREINALANTAATGVASATLPDNTTMMGACVLASNAALATATSVQIGVVTIYVQTDY